MKLPSTYRKISVTFYFEFRKNSFMLNFTKFPCYFFQNILKFFLNIFFKILRKQKAILNTIEFF